MKVLYDYQIFDEQKIGGISRYFYEIMKGMDLKSYELGLACTDNLYLRNDSDFNFPRNPYSFDKFISEKYFFGKDTLFILRNKILGNLIYPNKKKSIELLKKGDFDVFHPTYYDPYFLDYIGNKPFVLTIHDMIHEKYPDVMGVESLTRIKKILAHKAAHIMANSEFTKKDIMNIYGISEDKISIDSRGSSLKESFCPVKNKTFEDKLSNRKYFLFTGSRSGYKNFYLFLRYFSELLRNRRDISLVCTGKKFSDIELGFFEELGIESQVFHVFANDSELYELYHNAVAFVFPSYYEGFGLPILEAFEAECPLLLANASCFPEIAGNAALYFEPKNKEQILDCCYKVLNDSNLRQSLIQKGKERFNLFSWKKCVEETVKVYERVCHQ